MPVSIVWPLWKLGMWRPKCGQQPRPRTRWNQRYLEVARSGMSREHALHAQFLRSDALWRADRCDQREVREALIASPKGDGQHRALRRRRRLQLLQRLDTFAAAPAALQVSHPLLAQPLPAELFAAGRLRPSPTPQQKAASPPDQTSGREGCAALVSPPDRQMSQRIAAQPDWFESHSSTGPAPARDAAHVAAASGQSRWVTIAICSASMLCSL